MKERPILFSGPMVLALLAGTKTQTRRVVKPQPFGKLINLEPFKVVWIGGEDKFHLMTKDGTFHGVWNVKCPYGQPGDRLWVRESWHQEGRWLRYGDQSGDSEQCWEGTNKIAYTADNGPYPEGWRTRPSIHMPRWASRITIEVTAVRVERLKDTRDEDAKAEGIELSTPGADVAGEYKDLWKHGKAVTSSPVRAFKYLWESINGPGSWDANPWVWVVEFKVL